MVDLTDGYGLMPMGWVVSSVLDVQAIARFPSGRCSIGCDNLESNANLTRRGNTTRWFSFGF